MKSCIYEGQVRHRRFTPKQHVFNYRLYMMFLDLEELPTLFDKYWLWSSKRFNLAWFKRADHMGDSDESLITSVRKKISEKTGLMPEGPIRILTHCRYFGFGFNPVSFYYCYDKDDQYIEFIVAEVNNTPWGEQYCYVLSETDNKNERPDRKIRKQYLPVKDFHVSPFMPMDMTYDWRFNTPQDRLSVHMQNFKDDEKIFDATLDLKQAPISSKNLARVLTQYPLITVKVVVGIYYEALRLLLKRIPFYDHPKLLIKQTQEKKA